MIDYTQHTIKLQDGSLFNFKRRYRKQQQRLLPLVEHVKDGRSKFGKRHPLSLIIVILFAAILQGATTIKDCHLWAMHNKAWLGKMVGMPHGLLDERTLARAIAKLDIDSLIAVFLRWRELLYGYCVSGVASFDGKTRNGCHGKDVIKHMLSLFTHGTHQIIGQIGVTQKENEIPALHRLLEQIGNISGMLLIGDALHTQKDTITDILSRHAEYLLFAKDNQEQLARDLTTFFADVPFGSVTDRVVVSENRSKRESTTTVTISHDPQRCTYLRDNGWENVQTVGKIHRTGIRISSDGVQTPIDETVYCIGSRILTAREVATHSKDHWQIENNLHWEKDWLYLEDRQNLRSGNAPQVMSFLRSMALSLFALWEFASPTETVSNLQKSQQLHHQWLRIAGVV